MQASVVVGSLALTFVSLNENPRDLGVGQPSGKQPLALRSPDEGGDPPSMILLITCNYPALSETFINREVTALTERGHRLTVVNCFAVSSPQALPETLVVVRWEERTRWRDMVRVARRLLARPRATLRVAGAALGLAQCAPWSRVWRGSLVFLRVLARGWESAPTLYVHYLSTPAIAAHLLSHWWETTFVASGHAADLFRSSPAYLRRVCSRARVVLTCTEAGRRHLELAGISSARVVRHGVTVHEPEVPRFRPHPRLRLVTVARLVEKKGHAQLLEVAGRLNASGCDFEWRFVGDGALADVLGTAASRMGLASRVRWLGARDHAGTLAEIGGSDLFVYHSVVTPDGDRDGVPNVLLEALVAGTRVLCSAFSGAEELRRLLPSTTLLEVIPFDPGSWAGRLARAAGEPLPSAAERRAVRQAILRHHDSARAVDLVERALGVSHPPGILYFPES